MIVVFANQKGGVGKTTASILLANFLVSRSVQVRLLDLDIQNSAAEIYRAQKQIFNDENLFEVIPVDLEQFKQIEATLIDNIITIIDLPGSLDNENLIPVFQAADLVICPTYFDKTTFVSTMTFSMVVKEINPLTKIVFLPNKLNPKVNYNRPMFAIKDSQGKVVAIDNEDVVNKKLKEFQYLGEYTKHYGEQRPMDSMINELQKFGQVLSPIFSSIEIERLNIFHNNDKIQSFVNQSFIQIYSLIERKKSVVIK